MVASYSRLFMARLPPRARRLKGSGGTTSARVSVRQGGGCRRRYRRCSRFARLPLFVVSSGRNPTNPEANRHQQWWKTPLPYAHNCERTEHHLMARSGCGYSDVRGQVDGQVPRDIHRSLFRSRILPVRFSSSYPFRVVLFDHLTEELVICLSADLLGFHELSCSLCHGYATCCVHVLSRAVVCSRRWQRREPCDHVVAK